MTISSFFGALSKSNFFKKLQQYFMIPILLTLLAISQSILIPITPNQKVCMAAFTDYEPLKLEVIFPLIPNKVEGEKFKITVSSTEDSDNVQQHIKEEGDSFKRILNITENVLYNICFEMITDRSYFADNQSILINYHLTDDLQNLIGTIEVPADLAKQKKLSDLYFYTNEIQKINKKIGQSQDRERKLEDDIAEIHIQKNFRIIQLTFLECAVIILSGIYQIFALRRFLIDKNLY